MKRKPLHVTPRGVLLSPEPIDFEQITQAFSYESNGERTTWRMIYDRRKYPAAPKPIVGSGFIASVGEHEVLKKGGEVIPKGERAMKLRYWCC